MKYIIIPIKLFEQADTTLKNKFKLNPRKSVNGSKIIMSVKNYERLFSNNSRIEKTNYPIYESDDLNDLLASSEWNSYEN